MNSHAYKTFIGEAADPRQTVCSVYEDICRLLANAEMSDEAKKRYRSENPHRYSYGNNLMFDLSNITDITAKDNFITVEFGYDKPCGRGCCSDWITDEMKIPDSLVVAHEAAEAWLYAEETQQPVNDRTLITAYVQSVVDDIEARIKAEKAEEKRRKEAAKKAAETRKARLAAEKEARDRAEYERLKEKFS